MNAGLWIVILICLAILGPIVAPLVIITGILIECREYIKDAINSKSGRD